MAHNDRVAAMFQGRTVLITGATGFLGKVLLEKILRSCSGVQRIYLLIRHKKNKTPQERLHDIFTNILFDRLKQEQPDAVKKCRAIAGDATDVDLGISADDRRTICQEVEFIYHSAASTRFDDSVRVAVKLNTRATKYMLDLAKDCKKLKMFMYVSTAYAFPKEKVLYEKAYKPPADPHEILAKIDFDKEDVTGETDKLMGSSPNTYTFSKALAEALVIEQMSTLPVLVVRPSVVCPIWKEPLPGWCNNLQGPMGLFVGAGKGVIRSMYVNSESYADFIPADIVINGMLLATWNFMTSENPLRVLNIIASSEYNLSWEEIINLGKDIIYNDIPFNGILWYPGGSLKKWKWLHTICFYLFQMLPALLIDLLLIVLGYKPILFQIQRRIQKGGEMFEYYTTKAWNFSNAKADELRARMNAVEMKNYKIDGDGLDLKGYFKDCMLSVRRNNLKETDDMLPAARRNMKIMWALDITCKTLFVFACIYYVHKWMLAPIFKM